MAGQILIVEDNSSTRMLLEQTLELEGYDVFSVGDGPSALDRIGAHRPALVLLDVMMPGLDGVEVLKKIREADATKDLPVVMLTALDDPDSTWKGWTSGCHYYMTKPFDPEDVVKVVSELLDGVAA
jgi:DNA-binding response OmpR family regulator